MADDPQAAIEALQQEQEELQEKHDRAQTSFHAARTKYGKAKDALVAFNTKYGRMLKLVVIQPEAQPESDEDEPSETVELTPDEVASVSAEDLPDTPTEE